MPDFIELRIQNSKLDEDFSFRPQFEGAFILDGLFEGDVISPVVPFSEICKSPEAHGYTVVGEEI